MPRPQLQSSLRHTRTALALQRLWLLLLPTAFERWVKGLRGARKGNLWWTELMVMFVEPGSNMVEYFEIEWYFVPLWNVCRHLGLFTLKDLDLSCQGSHCLHGPIPLARWEPGYGDPIWYKQYFVVLHGWKVSNLYQQPPKNHTQYRLWWLQ